MSALVDLGVISKHVAFKATRLDEITGGEGVHRVEARRQESGMVQHSKFQWKRRSQKRTRGRQ